MKKLAILDWGIGGVSIYKLIKEKFTNVPIIYFSDTGVTPYGKMSRPELVARLNAVIEFLISHGVGHLVIGCNAASTAIPHLNNSGIKIEGVIDSAVAAAVKLKPSRLGLIGGRRTVLSEVYRKAFAKHGIKLKQRIAQPLSGLIESGDVSSDKLRNECNRILSPLKNCSHILLACTHYPAIIRTMKEFVPSKTEFIDPSSDLLKVVGRWKINGRGRDVFLTSGSITDMRKASRQAWGVDIGEAEKYRIP